MAHFVAFRVVVNPVDIAFLVNIEVVICSYTRFTASDDTDNLARLELSVAIMVDSYKTYPSVRSIKASIGEPPLLKSPFYQFVSW